MGKIIFQLYSNVTDNKLGSSTYFILILSQVFNLRVSKSCRPKLQKACCRCHMFGLIALCFSVPFIATGGVKFKKAEHNAALCDVAPTVLDAMGLDVPSEMKGQSLLEK